MSGRTRPRLDRARSQAVSSDETPRDHSSAKPRPTVARAITLCLTLASLAFAASPVQAASRASHDAVGTKTLAVVLATWGPRPFNVQQVQSMLDTVQAWYAQTSYGQLTLKVAALHDWVTVSPPICDQSRFMTDAAFAAAGLKESDYNLTLEITPDDADCNFAGLGGGGDAWLNGNISQWIAEHELGHALGLDHSRSTDCALAGTSATCPRVEYGDIYDVMGSGADWRTSTGSEFNAFQRYKLGWLQPQIVAGSGDYTIAPLEQQSNQNSLVVPTAGGVYWFEHREPIGPDATLDPSVFDGLLVHQGSLGKSFDDESVLLRPYFGATGWVLDPGMTFTDPGVFTLSPTGVGGGNASVAFAWTDTQPPSEPVVRLRPGSTTAEALFDWSGATDGGSGLAGYQLTIDAGSPVALPATATRWSPATRLAPGAHTLTLVAIDRAGNRAMVSLPFTLAKPNATHGASANTAPGATSPSGAPATATPSGAATSTALGHARTFSARQASGARFSYSLTSAQSLTLRLFRLDTGWQLGLTYRTLPRRTGSFTLGRLVGGRRLAPGTYMLLAWAGVVELHQLTTAITISR